MQKINRRLFTLGSAALGLAATMPRSAFAQEMRSVTTRYGTYDIPVRPQRVVAIDSRLDLQPAIALGLPVIGYGHSVPGPWVPNVDGLEFYGSEINIEQVLAADPDLIICAGYDPDSVWWPANRLREIAPVVPTANDQPWKDAFRDIATLLGHEGAGEDAMAEYDALIADIKTRRAEQIATKTVVALQPGNGEVYLANGTSMLPTQVLADLGAKTIPALPEQLYNPDPIGAEGFGEALGDVDGLVLVTWADASDAGVAELSPWQRLKAIETGAVIKSEGNINYGSIYSAVQFAKFADELYGKLA